MWVGYLVGCPPDRARGVPVGSASQCKEVIVAGAVGSVLGMVWGKFGKTEVSLGGSVPVPAKSAVLVISSVGLFPSSFR